MRDFDRILGDTPEKQKARKKVSLLRTVSVVVGLVIGILLGFAIGEAKAHSGPQVPKEIDIYYFTQQAEVDALKIAACETQDVFQLNAAMGYLGAAGSVVGLIAYNLGSMRTYGGESYYKGEALPNVLLVGSIIVTTYIAAQYQYAANAQDTVCNSKWPIQGTKGER